MLWIFLALLGAVANAAYFIIIKKYIPVLDPRILTGIGFTLGGILLFAMSASRGFPAIGPEFFPGQRVVHKTFGKGIIREFIDMGENSVVVVKFSTGQIKSLMVKYAGLSVLDDI